MKDTFWGFFYKFNIFTPTFEIANLARMFLTDDQEILRADQFGGSRATNLWLVRSKHNLCWEYKNQFPFCAKFQTTMEFSVDIPSPFFWKENQQKDSFLISQGSEEIINFNTP